jgi:NTP pyrophosphatase (non-canonical NTP hydrolase)
MTEGSIIAGVGVSATDVIGNMLNEASRDIQRSNADKGFYDDYQALVNFISSEIEKGELAQPIGKRYLDILKEMFISSKIALIHSELSEALEAVRAGIENDDKIPEYSGYEAEMADTFIRVADLAGFSRINLGGAFQAKLAKNKTREYKHGKRF